MEMKMAMATEVGDQKQPETQLPATISRMTIEPKDVSPDGDLHYEFELDQFEIKSEPGTNPMIVNAMKQQAGNMKGMKGSATVTSRGIFKDAQFTPPPGMDPKVSQFMETMKDSMNQMSAPLPENPVGVGAVWQMTTPIDTPVMKLSQVVTYTLTDVQGDTVKLDVAIEQSAPEQEIKAPGAPAGTEIVMDSLESSGVGTLEVHMTSLVPTSEMNMTTTTAMTTGGQKIKATMRMAIKIHP